MVSITIAIASDARRAVCTPREGPQCKGVKEAYPVVEGTMKKRWWRKGHKIHATPRVAPCLPPRKPCEPPTGQRPGRAALSRDKTKTAQFLIPRLPHWIRVCSGKGFLQVHYDIQPTGVSVALSELPGRNSYWDPYSRQLRTSTLALTGLSGKYTERVNFQD